MISSDEKPIPKRIAERRESERVSVFSYRMYLLYRKRKIYFESSSIMARRRKLSRIPDENVPSRVTGKKERFIIGSSMMSARLPASAPKSMMVINGIMKKY